MSRVALADIPRLTLYKDKKTRARRVSPIQQLKCVGSTCKLFQPDVVRCYNDGGEGIDVDWKCEADLPDKLRFGEVRVSCEGYDYAGDPFVLNGSCGLEYELKRVKSIGESSSQDPSSSFTWENLPSMFFSILTIGIFIFIIYTVFGDCCSRSSASRREGRPPGSSGPGGYSAGGPRGNSPPPPPYTSYYSGPSKPFASGARGDDASGFTPGFWTGVGLGGLGGAATARYLQGNSNRQQQTRVDHTEYDWERRNGGTVFTPDSVTRNRVRGQDNDRGEGPSGLGQMRASTGFGYSTSR